MSSFQDGSLYCLALRSTRLEKWACSHLGDSPLHSWGEAARFISAPSRPAHILHWRCITKCAGGGMKAGLAHRVQPSLTWESWKKNNEIITICCTWNHVWTQWDGPGIVQWGRNALLQVKVWQKWGWAWFTSTQKCEEVGNQVTVRILF